MLKVVVVGGNAGGMSMAAKLKRTMKDQVEVIVFEKGEVTSLGACGIPYYVGCISAHADDLVERTPEKFREAGIDLRTRHEVAGGDLANKKVTALNLENDKKVEVDYDKLVVASGARVRHIQPFDVERDNLHTVRTLDDAIRLKKALDGDAVRNVVVTGAGFIGLEIAEACAKRGKKVLLVEFANRILPVMDPEITDRIMEELDANGVRVRTDAKVSELICDNNHIREVVIQGSGKKETVPADVVVNCAGIVPNAEFIGVKKAVNGAIEVDCHMRTSDPDVYAAGDCSIMTSFITGEHMYAPLGTNANKQGRMIAEQLAGKEVTPFKLIGSSAVRIFGLDAAKVGLSEIDAQRLNLDYKVNLITGNSYASYYAPDKVTIKLVYNAKTRLLLGAQTVGQGVVVARANYYAIAISAGVTVDEFGFMDLCYSPPFSGVWDVSLIAATTAK